MLFPHISLIKQKFLPVFLSIRPLNGLFVLPWITQIMYLKVSETLAISLHFPGISGQSNIKSDLSDEELCTEALYTPLSLQLRMSIILFSF